MPRCACVRHYYVTVIDSLSNAGHKRVGFLAGPFRSHQHALALVDRTIEAAKRADRWTDFYAFGTAATAPDSGRVGILNQSVGLDGSVLLCGRDPAQ